MGIDLGTTNSCVAIYKENDISPNPEIVLNDGERITPSFVTIAPNQVIVGKTSLDQRPMYPRNTFYQIKRLIGKKSNENNVQKDIRKLQFKVDSNEGKIFVKTVGEEKFKDEDDEFTLHPDKEAFEPEQISAFILHKLKKCVDDATGGDNKDCVITVPATFNEYQRRATKDAAKIAGLNPLAVINEPTAACIQYAHSMEFKNGKEQIVLVFDYGGGTLDVSLVKINGGEFTVLATAGDSHCGGSDIDEYLLQYVNEDSKEKYGIDLNENDDRILKLRSLVLKQCEEEKIKLTSLQTTTLKVPNYSITEKDATLNVTITRSKIDDYFKNQNLEKLLEPVKYVMKKLPDGKKIDTLILVGGSSKIQIIQEELRKLIGISGYSPVSPESSVAEGAAVYGAYLKLGKLKEYPKLAINDVTPMDIGFCLKKGGKVLIPKNTIIPHQSEFIRIMFNSDCDEHLIRVYEGDNNKEVENNHQVGELLLKNPGKSEKKVPYYLSIEANSNGIYLMCIQSDKKPNKDTKMDKNTFFKYHDLHEETELTEMYNKLKGMIELKTEENVQYFYKYNNIIRSINDACKKLVGKGKAEGNELKEFIQNERDRIKKEFEPNEDKMTKDDFIKNFRMFENKVKAKYPGYVRNNKINDALKEINIDI